jgi:hypothetical protein
MSDLKIGNKKKKVKKQLKKSIKVAVVGTPFTGFEPKLEELLLEITKKFKLKAVVTIAENKVGRFTRNLARKNEWQTRVVSEAFKEEIGHTDGTAKDVALGALGWAANTFIVIGSKGTSKDAIELCLRMGKPFIILEPK